MHKRLAMMVTFRLAEQGELRLGGGGAYVTPQMPLTFFFCLPRAAFKAYGNSQAGGQIRAAAAGLHHSHSNTGSLTHWLRPGIKPASSWVLVRFITTELQWELLTSFFFFNYSWFTMLCQFLLYNKWPSYTCTYILFLIKSSTRNPYQCPTFMPPDN